MKKIFAIIIIISYCMNCPAQNVGINTTTPQAYGHGGNNRVLELKNDAGTGADIQSHVILSSNGTAGSLGSLTWAAPNVAGAEKRTGLIANVFETTNTTRMAFYTRTPAGTITEKFSINGNGNVGIGTTTPGFPLNFANTTGDKISLFGNTGNHYGFGIQSGLLQIHTDLAVSNIAFGYGSSGNFNERMRILNNTGYDGMSLNGRLILKNGSADLVGGGAGVWLYKADNTGQLGFMGAQNNQNIGFYGGPGGWGFTYDAINSRVGIGNNNPNAPLAFPPSLGKKITLYPGATGDVGFAVAGNRLQIYADNPNADVAIGYDAAGTFNERFAVKPNGALAINGNTGSAGQLIISNGNSPAEWKNLGALLPSYTAYHSVFLTSSTITPLNNATINFSVSQPSKIFIWYNVNTYNACLVGPCHGIWQFWTHIDGAQQFPLTVQSITHPQYSDDDKTVGPEIFTVAAGSHSLTFNAQLLFGGSFAVQFRPYILVFSN